MFTQTCAVLGVIAFAASRWSCMLSRSLYWYFSTAFLMAFPAAIAWYRNPSNVPLLPDIGHDLLPTLSGRHELADATMKLHIGVTLGWILWQKSPRGSRILTHFFTVAGWMNLLRSGMLILTSIPDPYEACVAQGNQVHTWAEMPWADVLRRAVRLASGHSDLTCGDMIFSGHATIFSLCALVWYTYYTGARETLVRVTAVAFSATGMALIIMTRMHYSIDIAIALYLSVTLWFSPLRIPRMWFPLHREGV